MANLTPKDRCVLSAWLRANVTLEQVEAVSRFGLVDNERFTEAAVRAYRLLWTWSAWRLHGAAGDWHERVRNKLGAEFHQRRMARCMRILNRLKEGN